MSASNGYCGATDFLTPVRHSYILTDPAPGWDGMAERRIARSSDL
jgi:hypothetical protein